MYLQKRQKTKLAVAICFFAILTASVLVFGDFFTPNAKAEAIPLSCGNADINRDGTVDDGDLAIMSMYYRQNVEFCDSASDICRRADIIPDGSIDVGDLGVLATHMHETGCGEENSWCSGADINRDGQVNGSDTEILSGYYRYDNEDCTLTADFCRNTDINNDRMIDVSDLGILATHFHETDCVVPDTTPPVITLIGEAEITLTLGSGYTDAGATALDDVDGDISSKIIIVNPVDLTNIGDYTITYNVSDAAGNAAAQVIRLVHIVAASVQNNGNTPSGRTIDEINGGGGGSWILGDVNKDGEVNFLDVEALMVEWGKEGASDADLNNDGVVNEFDLAIIMENWTEE